MKNTFDLPTFDGSIDGSLQRFTVDSSVSVISVETKDSGLVNVKNFSDQDWGIYKYRIDGLVGRLVKIENQANGDSVYDVLLSLKDVAKLPAIEELKDGEIISQVIEKNKMSGFSLAKFLGLSVTEKYCLQYMEKDIKSVFIEDHDFDLKLAKKIFDQQKPDFDINKHFVINGVLLQQLTYKEYCSGDTRINAADIPVDATILVSGKFAYTSSNLRYTVRFRVKPNFLPAKAIKERADLIS
jgi:hypothetical protein